MPFATSPGPGAFGLAMVFVLLTYGGWNEAATLSAELKGGRRAIAHALWLSLAIIAASYVAVNLALLHGLGLDGLARSQAPAADIVGRAFGAGGGALAVKALGLSVAIATLTSINGTMIVGARTNYAVGCDWPPLRILSRWHGSRGVPVAAHLVQTGIALALVGFGSLQHDGFEAMVEFTAPVFWGFLSLVALAVPVLRKRDPGVDRPFRVPLYPLTPVVFCVVCVYLTVSSIGHAASRDAVHISLLLVFFGVAAWALARSSHSTKA
jgi:APA family basic amino acid/polyamine antiporter